MEEKSSRGMENWQEDMYWNHFNCIHFISNLSGDFHEHLAIPVKFASKMKNKLPDTVALRGPSKNTWNVKLSAEDNALILKDGWKEFVKDHALGENDTLVFQYNKKCSRFDVLLFNKSTQCEKESSYFFERTSETNESQKKRKTIEDVQITEEEDDVVKRTKVSYLWNISNRRAVTEEEKENALQKARAAANPDSVVVVLRPKNVHQCFTMKLSHEWMGKYVSLDDKFLILRETGKKVWLLPLKHVQDRDTWQLKFGWEDFALKNNLEESDVCVFNPAGRNGDDIFQVDVIVFRVVDEEAAALAPVGLIA